MTKETKVKMIEERIKLLQNRGKDNVGIQSKLKRKLRKLVAD